MNAPTYNGFSLTAMREFARALVELGWVTQAEADEALAHPDEPAMRPNTHPNGGPDA